MAKRMTADQRFEAQKAADAAAWAAGAADRAAALLVAQAASAALVAKYAAEADARTPEQKAAADAYEAARSESQAQQAAAHRAADYGSANDFSDDSAHCEGSDDIHVSR